MAGINRADPQHRLDTDNMDTQIKLKAYPSGFMGSTLPAQTQPVDVSALIRASVSARVLPAHESYTANAEVMRLVGEYTNPHSKKAFDFGEAVCRVAKRAFGTRWMVDWLDAQLKSSEFSMTHQLWLDETLAFVILGVSRRQQNLFWKPQLCVDATPQNNLKDTDFINHFIKGKFRSTMERQYGLQARNLTGMKMDEFLTLWLARPGGCVDLMTALDVMYGDR